MMDELYKKLVDLYAGRELPVELDAQLEQMATNDQALAHDMYTLRHSVDALKSSAASLDFSEESYQRILMKLYARAGQLQTSAPEPTHLQYYLPIQST